MQKRFQLEPGSNTDSSSHPRKKRKYDFVHVPEEQLDPGLQSQKELLDLQRAIGATDDAASEKKEAQRIETAHRRAAAFMETRRISLYNEKAKQLNIPLKESQLIGKSRTTQPHHRRQRQGSKDPEMVCTSCVFVSVICTLLVYLSNLSY